MKYFVWPFLLAMIFFFTWYFINPNSLTFSYAYLYIGLILLVFPIVTTLSFFPRLLSKYVKVGAYFSALMGLFEFTGVTLNHWIFPGKNFIGWVPYFGYKIPVEEFIFWIVLTSVGILSYYEFFDDDTK